MKTILFALFVGLTLIGHAQIKLTAKSGDSELDIRLNELNVQASVDLGAFKASVAVEFKATEKKVAELCKVMSPAEVYFAFQLSLLSKKPIDTVVTTYKTNKTKGWGVIAKELGIKPGSAEFHKLKDSVKGKTTKMKGSKGKGNSNGKSNGNGNSNGNGKGKSKGK